MNMWEQVFEDAMQELTTQGDAASTPFMVSDIEAYVRPPVDTKDAQFTTYAGLYKLKDGRFAFLCVRYDVEFGNPSATCIVSNDLDRLVQFGLDQDARDLLGVTA